MATLLDAIGAMFIGGSLLVTMLAGLFNIQETSTNTKMFITLVEISESVSDNLDEFYLTSVGAGVASGEEIILNATKDQFKYIGSFSDSSGIDTIDIKIESEISGAGFPLNIYRNNILEMGPFWLTTDSVFTFYDKNENVNMIPDSIYSMQMVMEYFFDSSKTGMEKRLIKDKIFIWHYFRNKYL